jgi:hypothetical protein
MLAVLCSTQSVLLDIRLQSAQEIERRATMRSNALNLVSAFLLFPTALALLFAWEGQQSANYDLAFVVWLWFGLPGLALSAFLFWLGRPNQSGNE